MEEIIPKLIKYYFLAQKDKSVKSKEAKINAVAETNLEEEKKNSPERDNRQIGLQESQSTQLSSANQFSSHLAMLKMSESQNPDAPSHAGGLTFLMIPVSDHQRTLTNQSNPLKRGPPYSLFPIIISISGQKEGPSNKEPQEFKIREKEDLER